MGSQLGSLALFISSDNYSPIPNSANLRRLTDPIKFTPLQPGPLNRAGAVAPAPLTTADIATQKNTFDK